MPINTLEYRTQLTNALDKKFVQKSVTSFLEDASMRAKFIGTKTVLMSDADFAGLGNYDRDTGFSLGGTTITHTPYTLTMDRGRTFSIDREDIDEIGISNLAGQFMGEFVRTKVVPEVDAYTLSKLSKLATDNGQTVTFTGTVQDNPVKLLTDLINAVQDATDSEEELVAFLHPTVYAALMYTPELTRQLNVAEFNRGEVSTKIKTLNGCALIKVPSLRMKSAYTFDPGESSTAGGFKPADEAKDVAAIVMPKRGASLVKKTVKVRTFTPDENQRMDAYKFDYRIYYDAFVRKSQIGSIFTYVNP